jgi:AcrR family transcriptional regulator
MLSIVASALEIGHHGGVSVPSAARTARERARAELTREITRVARRHLETDGPNGLSLRAVTRDLGISSSAVYRYFSSRDELLTALIIEAYDELGAAAETADARVRRRRDVGARWTSICRATRGWALEHRHDYALLYGSPVPGYAAPQTTVEPASRIPRLLVALLHEAGEQGRDPGTGPAALAVPAAVRRTIAPAREFMGPGLSDDLVVRALMAWTHLLGAVSFELFGHRVGSVADYGVFFDHEMHRVAVSTGLVDPTGAATGRPDDGPTR